jgi:hypothetical protein
MSNTKVKYSWVGNPAKKCPVSCGASSPSPNGDPGTDAVASIFAHEL